MLDTIFYTKIGFLFNVLYYRLLNGLIQSKEDRVYKINILLSLLHCSLGSCVAILYLFIGYDLMDFMRYYSVGYLLLDTLCINTFKELEQGKNLYNFHHLVFLLGWFTIDENRYMSCRILICELSTILLDLRYLSKYYWPSYHNSLGLSMMSVFFIVRILNNIDIHYMNNDFILKYYYLFYSYFGLQIYWFTLMGFKVYKLFLGKEE